MSASDAPHALQAELDRLLAEKSKTEADLHNTGDRKYARRLRSLQEEILAIETAIGDARV